jgi:hypothetical protein
LHFVSEPRGDSGDCSEQLKPTKRRSSQQQVSHVLMTNDNRASKKGRRGRGGPAKRTELWFSQNRTGVNLFYPRHDMDILEETCLGLGSIVGTVDQTGYEPNLNTSA